MALQQLISIPSVPYQTPVEGVINAFSTLDKLIANAELQKQQKAEDERRSKLFPEELKKVQMQNEYDAQINPLNVQKAKLQVENFPNELNQLNREREIKNALDMQRYQQLQITNPLAANKMRLENAKYNEIVDSEIAARKSLGDYRSMGGAGLGSGGREELMFQGLVAQDNPQLKNPQQVYEASNVLRQGGDTLSDGTKLNPLSPAARASFDRLIKGQTTSGALTPLLKSAQSEKEIEVISEFAQKGLEPYGKTYFNKSPEQIMDTFKSDEKSQKRLGKFIAAQQLQYEIAQNEIKLAAGQPGITSTQELMNLGAQMIDAKYPRLSYTARQEANRYFLEALKAGFEARKGTGISPSKTMEPSKNKGSVNREDYSKMSDQELRDIINGP